MSVSLPPLNKSDQKKLSGLLQRGELLPVLNNTKWAELIKEMQDAVELAPEFRIKSIFSAGEHVTDWDREWHYHIHPVAEIEWLELRCQSHDRLLSILREYTIPFSLEKDVVRIWGYTRPGVQPSWH